MIDLPVKPTRREGEKYVWDFIYKGDVSLHDLVSHKHQLMVAGFRIESFVIKATDHTYEQGCLFSVLHIHIVGISLISRGMFARPSERQIRGREVKEIIEDEHVDSG